MNLRHELEIVLRGDVSAATGVALQITMANFLRDHGPALLEAVRDAERYDWIYRNWILITKGRGMFGEFPVPYGSAGNGLNAVIDAAREGEE